MAIECEKEEIETCFVLVCFSFNKMEILMRELFVSFSVFFLLSKCRCVKIRLSSFFIPLKEGKISSLLTRREKKTNSTSSLVSGKS